MNHRAQVATTASLGLAALGGLLFFSRRAWAQAPVVMPEFDLPPLPQASDVAGDLLRNWGETPSDLRPLLMHMEEVSRIPGSSRVFAVIAYRESRFQTTAHTDGDSAHARAEREQSRKAYENGKSRNPPLRYAKEAADFGSGGLFGALAPNFLWTGTMVLGKQAPLIDAPPTLLFQPRAAAFGACVYLHRLLAHYRVDDVPDIKVGWASPNLLGKGRGGTTYQAVRKRFLEDAQGVGIDLDDAATIPPRLDHSAWPGTAAVFDRLVGSLSTEVAA